MLVFVQLLEQKRIEFEENERQHELRKQELERENAVKLGEGSNCQYMSFMQMLQALLECSLS